MIWSRRRRVRHRPYTQAELLMKLLRAVREMCAEDEKRKETRALSDLERRERDCRETEEKLKALARKMQPAIRRWELERCIDDDAPRQGRSRERQLTAQKGPW